MVLILSGKLNPIVFFVLFFVFFGVTSWPAARRRRPGAILVTKVTSSVVEGKQETSRCITCPPVGKLATLTPLCWLVWDWGARLSLCVF